MEKWRKRGRRYHGDLASFLRFHIPEGSSVLEIGCSTGWLLAALKPARGVGVDLSERAIEIARENWPDCEFIVGDAEDLRLAEKFDHVILSNLVGHLTDVYQAFVELRKVCTPRTRVYVTHYSKLWEPLLKAAVFLLGGHAQQSQISHLQLHIGRDFRFPFNLFGYRLNLSVGKVSGQFLEHLLFIG